MQSPSEPRLRRGFIVAFIFCAVVDAVWIGPALFTSDVRAPADLVTMFEPLRTAAKDAPAVHNPMVSDWALEFWPWQRLVRKSWARGEAPLWNDLVGTGQPLAANQQCEAFSPYLPLSLLSGEQYPDVKQFAQMLLAQLLVLLFARCFGLSATAATLMALAYSFSSYMQSWVMHPHAGSAAFGPAILWGLMEARRGRRFGAPLAALALGASVLSGHIETSFLCAMSASIFAFLWSPPERPGMKARLRFIGTTLLVATVGLGIAAIDLVLLFQYFAESDVERYRSTQPPRSLPLVQLLSIFDPFVHGRPTDPTDPYTGTPNFVEGVFFVGRIVLAGAFIGAVYGLVRRFTLTLAALLTIAFAFYTAYTPIERLGWLLALPPFDRMPLPRMSFVAVMPLMVLAGLGFEALLTALGRHRRLIGSVLLGLAAFEACFVWSHYVPTLPARTLDVSSPLLARMSSLRPEGRILSVGGLLPAELNAAFDIGGIRAFDAILLRRHFRWIVESKAFYGPNFAQSAVYCDPDLLDACSVKWLLSTWPAERSAAPAHAEYVRPGAPVEFPMTSVKGARLEAFVYRGRDLTTTDGTLAIEVELEGGKLYRHVFGGTPSPEDDAAVSFDVSPDAAVGDLFANNFKGVDSSFVAVEFHRDALPLRVRLVVEAGGAPTNFVQLARNGFGASLGRVEEFGSFRLTERTSALPRAYLAPSPARVDDVEAAIAGFVTAGFDPHAKTMIEAPPERFDAAPIVRTEVAALEAMSPSPRRVSVNYESNATELLVVTDAWYPGCRAHLEDGTDLEVMPANLVGRAVVVPPGKHTVTFETDASWHVRAAAVLSVLALLGSFIWLCRPRRRSAAASPAD